MLIMLVIVVDVVMRYFFSAPLSWSYDLIGMYLVTLVFFLALADTFRRGGHIKVDLFENLRRTKFFAVAEILGYCASLVFFALILKQMLESGRSEEHTSELQSLMRISYAVFCLK